MRALPTLEKLQEKNPDIQSGINIVRRALEEPVRQIANNAGQEGSIVVARVKEKGKNEGFDANSEKYVDMIEAGIIDPTKVVRTALQNASSIASLMLTTEVLITEIPEKEKLGAGGPPPGMGGGGMY